MMRIWTAISYNTNVGKSTVEVFHGPQDATPAAKEYTRLMSNTSKLVALIPGDHRVAATKFDAGIDVGGPDFPSGF